MSSLTLLEQMLTKGRGFWWALFGLGSGLLAAALYWQYVIGDDPCQVCIQARLWAVALGLLGAVMLLLPESLLTRLVGLIIAFIASAGMGERAYYLFEIENFRSDGSCEFTLGMPSWFAVDQWFPALFEVRNICSYTPEIAFGISMAEALMGVAFVVCVVTLIGLGLVLRPTVDDSAD